jgi:hypothetical protein
LRLDKPEAASGAPLFGASSPVSGVPGLDLGIDRRERTIEQLACGFRSVADAVLEAEIVQPREQRGRDRDCEPFHYFPANGFIVSLIMLVKALAADEIIFVVALFLLKTTATIARTMKPAKKASSVFIASYTRISCW